MVKFDGDVRLKNGQVDTLQIAGNAITTSRVQYTEESKTIIGAYPTEISSLTIDSAGGSVSVSCNLERLRLYPVVGYNNPIISDDSVTMKIYREGKPTPLRSIVFKAESTYNRNSSGHLDLKYDLDYAFATIANFIDYPPAGEVRYYITVESVRNDRNLYIAGRSLTLFGAKR